MLGPTASASGDSRRFVRFLHAILSTSARRARPDTAAMTRRSWRDRERDARYASAEIKGDDARANACASDV
ncbi:hypothetical protein AKJ09_07869 [Labilithrix luteola]|uniref:Uncharacterized protein n=1 Tax=Labilithrix luteola TaxID=1391654 RepID=A0A0K1Q5X5_9BACT|nr:hypothetical protein AKJ09_07869 [Labilithrix luteola]